MILEYSSTLALRELISPSEPQLVRNSLLICAFCESAMSELHRCTTPRTEDRSDGDTQRVLTLCACPACGWWNIQETSHQYTNSAKHVPMAYDETDFHLSYSDWAYMLYERVSVACGSLKQLDVTDATIPMRELEAYLLARYGARYRLTPRRFEELVAGIFADFGFRLRITSFSGDDGIDVVLLDGPVNDVIGIQVKTPRRKGRSRANSLLRRCAPLKRHFPGHICDDFLLYPRRSECTR